MKPGFSSLTAWKLVLPICWMFIWAMPVFGLESSEALKPLLAHLPKDPTCELKEAFYSLASLDQDQGPTTFLGTIVNRTFAPFEVIIQAGYKRTGDIESATDRWLIKSELKSLVGVGPEGQGFRLKMSSPPQAQRSIEDGTLWPVVALLESASGTLLDATVARAHPDMVRRMQFDLQTLETEQTQRVGDYEITYRARIPDPATPTPALFSGVVRNLRGKSESLLLQVGFISTLEKGEPHERWIWSAQLPVSVTPETQEKPFIAEVHCPAGIRVGLENRAYQPYAWLLTEEEQQARAKAEQEGRRPYPVSPQAVLVHPEVHDVEIPAATYSFTFPGKPGNAGRFEIDLSNQGKSEQKLLVRSGFLTSSVKDPWSARAWHFTKVEPIELKAGQRARVELEVPCHVDMAGLIETGRYGVYVLVSPGGLE